MNRTYSYVVGDIELKDLSIYWNEKTNRVYLRKKSEIITSWAGTIGRHTTFKQDNHRVQYLSRYVINTFYEYDSKRKNIHHTRHEVIDIVLGVGLSFYYHRTIEFNMDMHQRFHSIPPILYTDRYPSSLASQRREPAIFIYFTTNPLLSLSFANYQRLDFNLLNNCNDCPCQNDVLITGMCCQLKPIAYYEPTVFTTEFSLKKYLASLDDS